MRCAPVSGVTNDSGQPGAELRKRRLAPVAPCHRPHATVRGTVLSGRRPVIHKCGSGGKDAARTGAMRWRHGSRASVLPISKGILNGVTDDTGRPGWALRLRRERMIRGWSQGDAVAAMRTFSDIPLPAGLQDQWKRWERGRDKPDEFYRVLLAATFGTVVESIFPSRTAPVGRTTDGVLRSRTGMDTHELTQRIQRSPVDDRTLDALALTVEQLCCDYTHRDASELVTESHKWLTWITNLLDGRLARIQRKDILDAAGWVTLLIGCLEYDLDQPRAAEATRVAALQLASAANNVELIGWSHEMRAWFALTKGRCREVIEAAQAGQDAAPGRSVSSRAKPVALGAVSHRPIQCVATRHYGDRYASSRSTPARHGTSGQ